MAFCLEYKEKNVDFKKLSGGNNSDMKKILIANNNLHIGGVQKALVNLLWSIRGQYDITLLLFSKSGEYLTELPPDIKIIVPKSGYSFLGMSRGDTCGFMEKLGRSFYAAITRVFGRKYAIGLMSMGQKKLEAYDVAISYMHNAGNKAFNGGCNDFVLKHVSARKKIAFLHCDYSNCGANTPENNKMYARFDAIAACSRGCADSFIRANPELADKVRLVYNCHQFERIRAMAEDAAIILPEGKINILTVARFGKEKSVTRAIEALGKLTELRERYHYYIIGDGIQRPQVEQLIKEFHLEDNVTLLGEMSNPYGYMKAADLLLMSSISEAAPMVIGESASLGTPILSTETSSAVEMIEDTGFGWVCENNVEALADALSGILRSGEKIWDKKDYLSDIELNNDLAVAQFEDLFND